MNPTLLIFANRYAGTLARVRGQSPLETYAREAGFEPEVVYTKSSIHLRRELRDYLARGVERVAVAGGDGTIHAAVQVLAHTPVQLGILPQGTANNFAAALRLPLDLPSAFRVIADGRPQAVSLGWANGEYFTEAAGVGFFADALALGGSGRRSKSVRQVSSALLRLMLANPRYTLTLDLDGDRHVEDVTSVTVANSFRLGLGIPIAPQARLTDEHLDLVLIGALSRREYWQYFQAIRTQNHLGLPKVTMLKAREIRIHSRRPARVHVDDRARKKTPVEIRLEPRALQVIVDRL